MSVQGHKHSASSSQNYKAQLANAYNELGKELSSTKIRVVGNYTLGRVIGEGTYGKVRLGTHRLTSVRVAIKQIPKEMSATLTREIHHHRRLHHPHVTQLYEVIATENYIWLVTELCSGGELFDYLAEKGRLSEEEAKGIFGQLCLAIGYIHEKGVVHRDLKLENVLLDERCRVKLSDFGFTREFEKGAMLETYCGTTGYAAPEMLLAKKYLGPEVDIWSLGIILYCLLTGTLPFDDDDEARMREKIIIGKFEVPEWLSPNAQDLIRNVLQYEPTNRLQISQILSHPWFRDPVSDTSTSDSNAQVLDEAQEITLSPEIQQITSPAASETTFHSASSEFPESLPTTPEDSQQDHTESDIAIHPNPSESTIKRDIIIAQIREGSKRRSPIRKQTQDNALSTVVPATPSRDTSPHPPADQLSKSGPPPFPTRTPARTKRRSVSSILSQASPTDEEHHFPLPKLPPQNYATLLDTPAPLAFSTPLERTLLNSLSELGFDIGQMVHSVLSDACDASGALWWMLKRKAEKKALEEALKQPKAVETADAETEIETEAEGGVVGPSNSSIAPSASETITNSDPVVPLVESSKSAPELSFVPPTPTAARDRDRRTSPPVTPPRSRSPRSLLSPTPTSSESLPKSTPTTPSNGGKDGSRVKSNGKPRSGSVSIMVQRAATALEAAGLVRKKSTEAVKEEKEKKEEGKKSSSSESRNGNVAFPSKLQKSPPLRPMRDNALPSTPEHEVLPSNLPSSSPWVGVTRAATFAGAPTPSNSPGDVFTPLRQDSSGKSANHARNRTSILSTFRGWFNEDRKGKRKAATQNVPPPPPQPSAPPISSPNLRGKNGVKRGSGSWNGHTKHRTGKRASVSSRRSSSVNSRRSSAASMTLPMLETPLMGGTDTMPHISRQRSDPSRRSFTPNSELDRADHPSRPSSIYSYNIHGRHKKSPSTSSNGSAVRLARAASPMTKYHKRGSSNSSTRVVRQNRPPSTTPRPTHVRSNSTASSIHSRQSSRPGSFYDISETEGLRTGSPLPASATASTLDETPRKGGYTTVMVAQKKQTPFVGPSAPLYTSSFSRMSWRKAWGAEPPGWRSRQVQYPVEVLAIYPSGDQPATIRDVFTGRQSMSLGDESDWIDEDDDVHPFVGGLGQVPAGASSQRQSFDSPVTLSPAPRGNSRSAKKANATRNSGYNSNTRSNAVSGNWSNLSVPASRPKPGHSPISGNLPLPGNDGVFDNGSEHQESRMSRRQLPGARSGPAFKLPIQEEDEDEEE